MQGAIPTTVHKPTLLGDLGQRFGSYLALGAVAIFGLVILPALFHTLADHDVLLGQRVSLIAAVWLIIGLVLSVIALRAFAAIKTVLQSRLGSALDAIPELTAASGDLGTDTGPRRAAATSVARLLDLVILLVIQAMLRPPLVGVSKELISEAWVDGGYVVLVVCVTLFFLIDLRRASRPLIERLLWLGLNRVVPTAGFQTTSAAETFATRMTTTNAARSGTLARSAPPMSRSVAAPTAATVAAGAAEATVLSPPDAAAEPTLLAPPLDRGAADATVLAGAAGDEPVAATRHPVSSEGSGASPPAASAEPTILAAPLPAGSTDATVIDPAIAGESGEATIILEGPAKGPSTASTEPPREGKR